MDDDKDSAPGSVAVIGAGYVGLVTAACLARFGNSVSCVDQDHDRIRALRAGEMPFAEPGLAQLVTDGVDAGRLAFHSSLASACQQAEAVVVAVGTDEDGSWTDRHLRQVLKSLLELPAVPPSIIIRSTMRPGGMAMLHGIASAAGGRSHLYYNPEFTREGNAVADFMAPDRIVVGMPPGMSSVAAEPLRRLYEGIPAPMLLVDYATAELIKVGSNAFLATKIAFANELAQFCRSFGGDMEALRRGIGLDHRIGPDFLQPGLGFGGSCLPSQVDLLTEVAGERRLTAHVVPAVARSNRAQAQRVAEEILELQDASIRVAIQGLAFKAGTDDTRQSPALRLIDALTQRSVRRIRAYDPLVRAVPNRPGVEVCPDPYRAARAADVVVVATEWPAFCQLDWERMAGLVARREVYDARGVVDVAAATSAGFRVRSLVRQPADGAAAATDTSSAA
jgi:UDPglucose 6-dehydrogenase